MRGEAIGAVLCLLFAGFASAQVNTEHPSQSQVAYDNWAKCLQQPPDVPCQAEREAFSKAIHDELGEGPEVQEIARNLTIARKSLTAYQQCRQHRQWKFWKRCAWRILP